MYLNRADVARRVSPFDLAAKRYAGEQKLRTSVRFCFGSLFSSKAEVYGQCLCDFTTLPSTINDILKCLLPLAILTQDLSVVTV